MPPSYSIQRKSVNRKTLFNIAPDDDTSGVNESGCLIMDVSQLSPPARTAKIEAQFFEACLPAGCHPKIFADETLN
jgi:hypothetical protein